MDLSCYLFLFSYYFWERPRQLPNGSFITYPPDSCRNWWEPFFLRILSFCDSWLGKWKWRGLTSQWLVLIFSAIVCGERKGFYFLKVHKFAESTNWKSFLEGVAHIIW